MLKYLIITNSNEVLRVSPDRISHIESDGNYSSLVLIDGEKHIFSFNLSTFQQIIERQLGDNGHTLIRIGKQLIINYRYLYYININKQQITLADVHFPVKIILKASKKALRELKAAMEDRITLLLQSTDIE